MGNHEVSMTFSASVLSRWNSVVHERSISHRSAHGINTLSNPQKIRSENHGFDLTTVAFLAQFWRQFWSDGIPKIVHELSISHCPAQGINTLSNPLKRQMERE